MTSGGQERWGHSPRKLGAHPPEGQGDDREIRQGFELRNVPLLSRVGADRADTLRTDIDAAVAGWSDALLVQVDSRNQVLIADGRVVLGKANALGDKPNEHAVFLGKLNDGRHVWAVRGALVAPEDSDSETEVLDLRRAGHIF